MLKIMYTTYVWKVLMLTMFPKRNAFGIIMYFIGNGYNEFVSMKIVVSFA